MSLSETRLGADAPGLPAVMPPLSAALSRRAALFGAVTVAGVTAAAVVPAGGHAAAPSASPALAALVSEFDTVCAEVDALLAEPCHAGVDCEKVPGWVDRQVRLDELVADMYEVRAESLADIVLIAGFLQTPWVNENYETATDLGYNLADDILRLHAEGGLA